MALKCDDCGRDAAKYSLRFRAGKQVVRCHACANPKHAALSCYNPFAELTLDHAHDLDGKPIHVTSLRQLRQAETRYKFRSLVANERAADFDKPPQTKIPDLYEQMTREGKWLHPEIAEGIVREMRANGDIQ